MSARCEVSSGDDKNVLTSGVMIAVSNDHIKETSG